MSPLYQPLCRWAATTTTLAQLPGHRKTGEKEPLSPAVPCSGRRELSLDVGQDSISGGGADAAGWVRTAVSCTSSNCRITPAGCSTTPNGGPIRDRGGRSPSVQLNEPADQLREFLRSCGQPIEIQRLVLFTHPRSRLGTCRSPTVRIATSTDEIPGLLRSLRPPVDPDRRSRLKDLIERDHRHHQARRPSRGPRARPATRRNVR